MTLNFSGAPNIQSEKRNNAGGAPRALRYILGGRVGHRYVYRVECKRDVTENTGEHTLRHVSPNVTIK
jgi:hypothetical protein